MAGALSLARRRFSGGGSPDDDIDYGPVATPSAVPVPNEAPTSLAPPAQGALSSAQPVPQNPREQIARQDMAARNLQQEIASTNILKASGASVPTILDPTQRPGASNLPLLAAAGAMLKPTHSGGFSEALGNAFSAAVPVAESERKRLTDASLRNQLLGINQQKTDILQQRADTYATSAEGQLAIRQEANRLKALGLDETSAWHAARTNVLSRFADSRDAQVGINQQNANTRSAQGQAQTAYLEAKTKAAANPKATEASITRDAVESLTSKINPDTGENWTTEDALMHVKGVTQRLAQGNQRIDIARGNLDARVQGIQNTEDYRKASLALREKLGDSTATNALLADAARIAAATGKKIQPVLDDLVKGRNGLGVPRLGAPASAPSGGASSGASWRSLPDGSEISQGGVTYIKKGNDPSKWETK